jgi:predicted peptidase
MKAYLVLLALLVHLCGCIGGPSSEKLLRKPYTSYVDQSQREYFVYLPRGYSSQPDKQWPVMLFLHGNGERGNGRDELDYVITHGPLYEAWIRKKDLPFIIISPQLHMFGMDKIPYIGKRTRAQIPLRLAEGVPARPAAFPTPQPMAPGIEVKNMSSVPPLLPMGWEKVEADLLDMIALVQQEYRTDLKRLYITGLSYGGFGTWYMASKHPDLFAAMVPVVGWGHPSLMKPIAKAGLPVWAFAGGRDKSVEKKYFYAGINKLESMTEAEVRFTIEEDMAHDTWTRVYASDDVYTWMLSHSKP